LGGYDCDDAFRGRLFDIPAPTNGHGFFESIHGFESGAAFSDILQERCRDTFGSVFRAYLKRLEDWLVDDEAGLASFVAKRRLYYIRKLSEEADAAGFRPLQRPTHRFASLYAAACVAIEVGVLDWERTDIRDALLSCHMDGLRLAAKERTFPRLKKTPRELLGAYLREKGQDFLDLDAKRLQHDTPFEQAPGFFATYKGRQFVYLTSERLRRVVGGADPARRVLDDLASAGLADFRMVNGSREFLLQRPICEKVDGSGNGHYRRVHALHRDLLEG
jgi:hypothetical protein